MGADKFLALLAILILLLAAYALATPHAGEQIGAFIAAIVRGYREARG